MSSPRPENLYVIKRNGTRQPISFDTILHRISSLCYGLEVDPAYVSQQVVSQIYPGVKTTFLDEFSAQICAHLQTEHPDYGILATRIVISNNHKETPDTFSEAMRIAYENQEKDGRHNPLIHPKIWDVIRENADEINTWVNTSNDYYYDYFGYQTLMRSYLLKVNGVVIERPQYMLLRVSFGLWQDNLKRARESYEKLSHLYFTHATPTLFHCGSQHPQLLSCFLLGTDDSIDGIYKTITDCAKISKWAGGIGIHASEIRGKGAKIQGTQGTTSGIIPMLRVYNETARYVNQCFAVGTKIITRNGFVSIENITEGTFVWTGSGEWQPVLSIAKRALLETEKLYQITTYNRDKPVYVTGEHEILALRYKDLYDYSPSNMLRAVKQKRVKPKMIPVCELTNEDFVAIPAKEKINYSDLDDDEIFRAILYWRGDYSDGKAVITLRVDKNNYALRWLQNYLVGRNVEFHVSEDELVSKITFDWSHYEEPTLENLDTTKKRMSFLHGVIKSMPGYISTNSSEKMRLLRFICITSGLQCNFSSEKGTHTIFIARTRNYYNLMSQSSYKVKHVGFYHMGYIWVKISEIKQVEKRVDNVYDLNVKDDHTYTVLDLGVVHNSGRRNGSIAIYLEPHHPDILEFLELRKNHGAEEERCRDLFTALWVSDAFMERVERAQKHPEEEVWWPLIDPSDCRDMQDLFGDAYRERINECLERGRYVKKIPVLTIWKKMLASQIETGTPYVTNKDAVNRKSNHANIGVIRSSNLCNEIVEYSDDKEYACCCLASINLSRFYKAGGNTVDLDELVRVCEVIVRNLNRVIDLNFYPVPETERSNNKHRPLGIGIQGLADLFAMLGIAWEDNEAKRWNSLIMETISYGCWRASNLIARERREIMATTEWKDWAIENRNRIAKQGADEDLTYFYEGNERWTLRESRDEKYPGAYTTFDGSPLSNGMFQHDMWGVKPSGRWDWEELRADVMKYGVRNSLCTALMPTASTAQIMGNQECFEPFSNLLYVRRTIAGDFVILNKYLLRELLRRGLWSRELKDWMVASNGSIQNIPDIPEDLKRIYKTVYEVKQKTVIECAAARAPFVDQTQSMNLFFQDPSPAMISAAIMYGWKQGLKTLLYYLRSQPSVQAQQVTVDPEKLKQVQKQETKKSRFQEQLKQKGLAGTGSSTPDCEFCSS